MTTSAAKTQNPTTTTRDVRTFWRLALALLAPVPILGMGVSYLLNPSDGGAPIAEAVANYQAHPGRAAAAMMIGLLFVILLIPATLTVAWVTRRRAPRLTTAGVLLTVPAFLTAFPVLPGGDPFVWAAAEKGVPVGPVQQLEDVLWDRPLTGVTILLFLTAITVGLPLLGLALWRTRTAARWLAACLIAGTATHVFLPGHTLKGLGLLVAGVGFLGVTRALLHLRDDEFDLPPIST